MFANVPLTIISSFPLLLPYVLKSSFWIPLANNYLAAGESLAIFPAGLIWSVVIELPKFNKQYALFINLTCLVSLVNVLKNGGLWIYVDLSFHCYLSVLGTFNAFHLSVPCEIFLYTSVNIFDLTCFSTTLDTSSLVGHISLNYTSFPSLPLPIGSLSKSISHLPANA